MIVVGGWPGRQVVGLNGHFGVLPAAMPTAGDGSPLLDDVDPGDEATEFVWVLKAPLPSSGTVAANDDGGFSHVGAADGGYTTLYDLYTWAPGGPIVAEGEGSVVTSFGSVSTASGATLTAASSVIAGNASGSTGATAAGQELTAAAAIISGAASGQIGATADGVTLAAAASLVAGAASGSTAGAAAGAVLSASAAMVAGAAEATNPGSALGVTLTASASLLAGSAVGAASATGATAAEIWNYVLADGRTAAETLLDNARMMRIILAGISGKTSGLGTDTETYFGEDETTPRIVASFDSQGNRVSVTTDGAP